LTTEGGKTDELKPVKRSLVAAHEAARQARGRLSQAERAVLVAVEFTGNRRKLTAAARLAKTGAAVSARTDLDGGDFSSVPKAADIDFDASLAEFEELARSAGAEVAATLIQRRPKPDPATLVGHGKLEEIEGVIASTGADLVLFDHDLSPSQLRNLEAKLPCRVIDRTQLILDIFARHARTREGQLQCGVGATGVSVATVGWARKGDVPVGRWNRYARAG
jgi:GTPase